MHGKFRRCPRPQPRPGCHAAANRPPGIHFTHIASPCWKSGCRPHAQTRPAITRAPVITGPPRQRSTTGGISSQANWHQHVGCRHHGVPNAGAINMDTLRQNWWHLQARHLSLHPRHAPEMSLPPRVPSDPHTADTRKSASLDGGFLRTAKHRKQSITSDPLAMRGATLQSQALALRLPARWTSFANIAGIAHFPMASNRADDILLPRWKGISATGSGRRGDWRA